MASVPSLLAKNPIRREKLRINLIPICAPLLQTSLFKGCRAINIIQESPLFAFNKRLLRSLPYPAAISFTRTRHLHFLGVPPY
ncbi:hypothetical protein CDAR_466551 [Caerostris darwini]|uniref:Uncharacterized protein n=1 Tax=Caerostris darwini TaxID=1538125 RepID=A0AAV4PTF3_9ARAC|nr:hypothetical protein CDAR_466551 [Caerostris darwini]